MQGPDKVAVKPEWSWNTLPKQYIESACLLTDDEALVAYF